MPPRCRGRERLWLSTATEPCLKESAYFCIRVEHDISRPTGRVLWLDNYMHSYVDLVNPEYLEFSYTRSFAAAVQSAWPEQVGLDTLHIGGGGFSFPRQLEATRSNGHNLVLEIDPVVVDIAEEHLGLRTSERLQVRTGDGRIGIRRVPDDSKDLVVGDAFGGMSVPWHLTTREFVADVRRVLHSDGVYMINVIDDPPFRFARAELATLREQFDHVAAMSSPAAFADIYGANVVLIASDRELDLDAIAAEIQKFGWEIRQWCAPRSMDRIRARADRRLRARRPVAGPITKMTLWAFRVAR